MAVKLKNPLIILAALLFALGAGTAFADGRFFPPDDCENDALYMSFTGISGDNTACKSGQDVLKNAMPTCASSEYVVYNGSSFECRSIGVPTCGTGEVLSYDGETFVCVEKGADLPTCNGTNQFLTYNGTVYQCATMQTLTIPACGAGRSLTSTDGQNLTCVANPVPTTAVNGACGSDNGNSVSATPTYLCTAGTASAVSGSGPWSWSCAGTNGATTASCAATKAVVPGSQTYSTPGTYTFTVPTHNTMTVKVWGAGGGGAGSWMYNDALPGGASSFNGSLIGYGGGVPSLVTLYDATNGKGGSASGGSVNISGSDGNSAGGNGGGPGGGAGGSIAGNYTLPGNPGGTPGGGGSGGGTYVTVCYWSNWSGGCNTTNGTNLGGGGGGYALNSYSSGTFAKGSTITVIVGSGGHGGTGGEDYNEVVYSNLQSGGNGGNGRVEITWQ